MIILCSYDLGNSKHDFFPKRNYDKRVDARIISQKINIMNNSLFIENTFTFVVLRGCF